MSDAWSIVDVRDRGASRVLITGGEVLVEDGLHRLDLLIEDGAIRDLAEDLAPGEGTPRVDARGRYLLPGLINAHTHAHNNLSRASGDRWTLEQLRSRGSALYGDRTPEEQYDSAALGAVEMLRTGCTTAYDQCAAFPVLTEEGIEAVVRAYDDVGLRAVIAPSFADKPFYEVIPELLDLLPADLRPSSPSDRAAATVLRPVEHAIDRWHEAGSGRIKIALAPVIPGLCSDELLGECARLSREHGLSVHTHLAESKVQAVSAYREWGRSIVEHLDELGLLTPSFVAGHAVWVSEEDIHRMASAGCVAVHNPASNLRLGNGLAPVAELRERGVLTALGSDGVHASDNQNMFEAMRIAALISRVRFPYQPDSWLSSREAWRMATADGAAVVGEEGRIGAIRPGMRADLVLLRADSTFLTPRNDVLNLIVYSETGADVSDAFVDGKPVLADGEVLGIDEEALLRRAEAAAERLRAHNAAAWEAAERLDPFLQTACSAAAAEEIGVDRYGTFGPDREEEAHA